MAIGDEGPANKTAQKSPDLDSRSAKIANSPVRKVTQPAKRGSGDASYPVQGGPSAPVQGADPRVVDKPFRG